MLALRVIRSPHLALAVPSPSSRIHPSHLSSRFAALAIRNSQLSVAISFVLSFFRTLLHFFALRELLFPVFSATSELLLQNTRGGTSRSLPPIAARRHNAFNPSHRLILFMSLISKHFLILEKVTFRLIRIIPKRLHAFWQKHPGADPFALSFALVSVLSGITESRSSFPRTRGFRRCC